MKAENHNRLKSVGFAVNAVNSLTHRYHRTVKDQNTENPPLIAHSEKSNSKESTA